MKSQLSVVPRGLAQVAVAAPMRRVKGLTKIFGAATAVDRSDLVVRAREFLTIAAPSVAGGDRVPVGWAPIDALFVGD